MTSMCRPIPDRAALEAAHRKLRTATPLDAMLQNPTLKVVVEAVARIHMRRGERVDFKKLQANDHD
jgi:hypothetical protein